MSFDFDNMYCGAIRRGDIVLFSEEKRTREHAAVIIQDDALNQGLPTVICAKVEPYKKGDDVFVNEVLLPKEETGLGKDGICMLHKLETVDRTHIVAKKAELPEETIQRIYHAVDITLGRFRDRV
ncbi:MAG: hypothetical protein AUJ37_02370 [Candidatus Magasanikbacteria bacterium CG1_02_41_34]|uniref:Growth inhibitor PemK n=1 Tax=Candidatus Magasanikbacteria bacterium CG_4_10_14_0_2_um_filter_41_31 TaxID=1974639 RepID=A0A2M7V437_9BACT|nr:MAG: hypothetical protein AUJ37_02370 [Candidatus Magasanikbacteria bacterium CG1_02_41_34]PIZ93297.1 MAG: hypothetical protein COX83_02285 [Candidatus Magasanikbacteria bacterium CG_4_10_14_0_2_um_filter_41_31]